jgi:N-acetylmuramoyl-L-alanine amidase
VKSAGDGIYLLAHTEIPAVLVECGFLSNEAERALLKTEEYRTKLAASLFSSIMNYLGAEQT